jgi:2-polyprenyl-6-methoxyphenol hydroxylase-like FAD-dependent oxidoreductase
MAGSANGYDVIVVGARCAGSPTAMLLARKGYRVLVVDRATFPSDTVSTHVLQPLAVAALARWGLLDRLVATGCPPAHTYVYDFFGRFVLSGAPGTKEAPLAYCPRRIVLDKLLVDGAAEAGAEVREGFTVEDILFEDGRVVGIKGHGKGGASVTERAQVVVGADGRYSQVADAVQAPRYHEKPAFLAAYYSYWSGLPMHGRFETFILEGRGAAALETHDGLTLVLAGWPRREYEAIKKDVEGNFMRVFEQIPEMGARLRGAKREDRFMGASLENFFRKPYGPGWALVGDAGYNKDPITAQGIRDAFEDAERCATALDQALSGARPYEDAMADYQRTRDENDLPMYEFTCQLASFEPPPPEMLQLFMAIAGNQPAMDRFIQMNAGTISPAAFFAPESVAAMMQPARAAAAG